MKHIALFVLVAIVLISVPAAAQYGMNRTFDIPFVAPGTLKMDMKADSVAWAKAPKFDLTTNWDGAWSGHPTADIVSTTKLMWTTDTLYVLAVVEDFEKFYWGAPGTYAPWKGEQLFFGVDGTHAQDTLVDDSWSGWPANAPDKGPVVYKVWEGGITMNWDGGQMPVDSGWARGTVFIDTVNFVWGVEMAIYVPQIGANTQVGFNAGGANASLEQAMKDTANMDGAYAYYSLLSSEYPGGDVFHSSASFGTLNCTASPIYGMGRGLDVPYVAPGTLKMNMKADSVAWSKAPRVDLAANWDGAWSGHPTADIVSTAKLLWTTDTLYVLARVEDFEKFYWGAPGAYAPWKGEQLFFGVDGTHAQDTLVDDSWSGWPANAPDKGPVVYKVWEGGITMNWDGGQMPVDSGWARGNVYLDTLNFVWGVEMAIYVPQIGPNAKIGFNAGGANASLEQAMKDTANMDGAYAYYSLLSSEYPGGDVFHSSASYGTLTMIGGGPTGVEEGGTLPAQFVLDQNYPNPFNPSTTFSYAMPRSGNVTIGVFNVLGQEVGRLLVGQQSAGAHVARWDASGLGSGMYFYQLSVDGRMIATKKMMLLK
jgi:hypothetical protein